MGGMAVALRFFFALTKRYPAKTGLIVLENERKDG